jgi:hypothetical protein
VEVKERDKTKHNILKIIHERQVLNSRRKRKKKNDISVQRESRETPQHLYIWLKTKFLEAAQIN